MAGIMEFILPYVFKTDVELTPVHRVTLNQRKQKATIHKLQKCSGLHWITPEFFNCVSDTAMTFAGAILLDFFRQCLLHRWRCKGAHPFASCRVSQCVAPCHRLAHRIYKVWKRQKRRMKKRFFHLWLLFILLCYLVHRKITRVWKKCKNRGAHYFEHMKISYIKAVLFIYRFSSFMHVLAVVIFLHLLMSGDVELNPGPQVSLTRGLTKLEEYAEELKFQCKAMASAPSDDTQWPPPVDDNHKVFRLEIVEAKQQIRRMYSLQLSDWVRCKTISDRVDEVVRQRGPIELKDIFSKIKGQPNVLMEGASGSGKSTLSFHIRHQWANGELFQDYKLVVLIRLRDLIVQNARSVAELLENVVREVAEEIMASQGEGILFILDGWNELPVGKPGHSVILDVIRGDELWKSSIITTSRPASSAKLHHHVSLRVEILGFSKSELRSYFSFCLRGKPKNVDYLLKRIKNNPTIEGICYLPLNANILVHLFIRGNGVLPNTQYGIFSDLICNCIYRYLRRTQPGATDIPKIKSLVKLPQSVESDFRQLCELAYDGIMNDEVIFHLEQPDFITLDLLHKVDYFDRYGGVSYSYNFLHLSIQELLAAYHIATRLTDDDQAKKFKELYNNPRFSAVFQFYAAITKLQTPEIKDVIVKVAKRCAVEDPNHTDKALFLSLLHCLYEAQDSSLCELVADPLESKLKLGGSNLSLAECFSLQYFLKHLENFDVDLNDCSIDGDKCKALFKLDQVYPIKSLDLSYNSLGDEGTHIVCGALKTMKNIQHLNLYRGSIGDKGIVNLLSGVKRMTTLQSLNIGGNSIEAKGAVIITEAMYEVPNLQQFKLGLSDIGMEAALSVLTAMKTMTTFPCMDLSYNYLGRDGAIALSEILKIMCNVHYLNLDHNKIRSEGCVALSEAFRRMTNLQHLTLRSNEIGSDGIVALSEALRGMTNLQYLNLCHNSIDDEGAVAIVASLIKMSNLQELLLDGNPIESRGAEALAEVKKTMNLRTLSIGKIKDDSQPETGGQQLLSTDELRILKIVLADHMTKLEKEGLSIEKAISDKLEITKESLVDGLRTIKQNKMADILAKKQGVKELQEFVFTNVYEEALKNEQHEVSLQVFKMILCGVPRSGKTTFWKRFALLKDFIPSENSPSTAAFESHFISANEKKDTNMNMQNESEAQKIKNDESTSLPHLEVKMLMDFHLYDDDIDLKNEALALYMNIIKTNESTTVNSAQKSITELNSAKYSDKDVLMANSDNQTDTPSEEQPTSRSVRTSNTSEHSTSDSVHTSITSERDEQSSETATQEEDPISNLIDEYFEQLKAMLNSDKMPDIKLIKKLCYLIDIGGQRAFLEMLPTVTVGKALYLLFFSYEKFEEQNDETVQKHGSSEVCTGTVYRPLEVIMQSLICVSTTTKTTSNNVALLVGTHVDKVEPHYVDHVNSIVFNSVKSFLGSTLVYAEKRPRGKDKLVLEVSIEPNKQCSNNPEDYQKVIMNLVEKRLKCSESEKLPASWYMFSILLRRIQYAGHSVIQYHHCQQIAEKLYIKSNHLQGLLSRMHRILGIILYFPEVEELKDIVICDPEAVYKGISELIFNSYDVTTHPVLALRLKRWGVFVVSELKERSEEQEGSQLALDKLIILLQHTGVIAPVNVVASDTVPSVKPAEDSGCIKSQYVIPCILDDALPADLKVKIEEAQACSIVPVRIYFACGFAPMGGFCYLFTKLITNNHDKGWQLLLPDIFNETSRSKNDIYWRNKVTFKVDEKYFVTLISTSEYYEIHIVHASSGKPFQLGKEGHYICRKVWNAVSKILSSSLNESQQKYKTACKCIKHQNIESDVEHVMTFIHNPDDNEDEITAVCCRDNSSVTVDQTKQSIAVWFKEPHDHQIAEIGEEIQLSVDMMLIVKSPKETFTYEWQAPNGRKIRKSDKRFKDSNTSILKIVSFEYKYRGAYTCVISTVRDPKLSLSAEVSVDFQTPPKTFDPEMSDDDFLLFLNMYGIPFEVCCVLLENDITAQRFNLSTFEYWSQQLEIRDMEKADLRQLITMCTPHHGLGVSHRLPTTAELSWPPLLEQQQNEITGYTVLAVGPDSTHEQTYTVDATANSFEVTGLRPSTSYTFRVFARSISKTGPVATISSTTPKGDTLPLQTFAKDLDDKQLALWLSNHPHLQGIECQDDIHKLRGAKIGGSGFLNLDKASLQEFDVSPGFQSQLMKIIKDLTKEQLSDIKVQPHLSEQVSPAGIAAAQHRPIVDEQQIPIAIAEIEETDTTLSSDQPSKHDNFSDSVQQQQPQLAVVTDQPQVKIHPQPRTFSKDMNNEQLALWLSNHPDLVGTDYLSDIDKLKVARINGSGFLHLTESRLEQFGVSIGFLLPLMSIIGDLQRSLQPSPTQRLLPQPQYYTDLQQTQHEPKEALATQVGAYPQPSIFSKGMNNEQLALWLTNHPSLIGTDYQEDIEKLKGAKINGYGFLSLNESRLERFGVSFGFRIPCLHIIEELKGDRQYSDSKGLPSYVQQQPPTSSVATPQTVRSYPTPTAGQQNKLDQLPTLDELMILKYKDKGEKKKIRIISEASHKWKDITCLICGNTNTTAILEQKCRDDPNECLRQSFIDNFISKKPHRGYSQNWSGLVELLDDIGLETLAEKVKHALSCT